MIKISVIVPVYRAEKYLNRCVDSILSQTYAALEVILIDDGSPDQSGAMCDGYARKDSRVKVIHQKNRGVAAARNRGLDMAAGDYITFVDSDDYIDPDMYLSMIRIIRKYDCDVVMCDCMKEKGNKSQPYIHDIRSGYYSREQLVKEYYPHLLVMETVEYPPTISNCLCIFRKGQYGNHLPRYIEGVRYSEDLLFGAELIYGANSFYYMKGACYYHYCMHAESATQTFAENKWDDYCVLYERIREVFGDCTDNSFDRQMDLVLLLFVYNAVGDLLKTDQISDLQKRKSIQEILREQHVKEMFSRISMVRLKIPLKLRVQACFYKYHVGIRTLIRYYGRKRRPV